MGREGWYQFISNTEDKETRMGRGDKRKIWKSDISKETVNKTFVCFNSILSKTGAKAQKLARFSFFFQICPYVF